MVWAAAAVLSASYSCSLSFILTSFGRIMSCLFRCFCLTNDTPQHSSDSISSNTRKDQSVSRNRLASLLASETDDEVSCRKDVKIGNFDSPSHEINVRELKDEAKFLKSCGTILETPIEIRKASERVKDLLPHDEDSETSKFHSWLPSTSIEKIHSEEQVNQLPINHVQFCDDLEKESGSPSTPVGFADTDQCRIKSVRFELEPENALLPCNGENTNQSNSPGSCKDLRHCPNVPYPTPLKLNDEMQTPGTVYPIYSENVAHGENARIRSQYVYNVLNPIQNFSQLMALKEADSGNHKQVDSLRESLEQCEDASPELSSVSYSGRENSFGNEGVDASLAHWMRQSSVPKNDRVQSCGSTLSGGSHSGKTSDMDRPILGTVAAHWNDDEFSRVSPKWWDGNGIPNSTNKYKEDQKVSWHAIPFEERLEKALSNESLVYQKNLSTQPIGNEENDTALSQMKVSKHPESVVSF